MKTDYAQSSKEKMVINDQYTLKIQLVLEETALQEPSPLPRYPASGRLSSARVIWKCGLI